MPLFQELKRRNLIWVGVVFLAAACDSSEPPAPVPVSIIGSPTVSVAGSAPLAYTLNVQTNHSTSLAVSLEAAGGHRYTIDFPTASDVHDKLLLGMRPDRSYSVSFTATASDGQTISGVVGEIVTPPLPVDFPTITVLTSAPDQMESGLTLMETSRKDRSAGYFVIVDAQGEVVWYVETDGTQAVSRLSDDGYLVSLTFTDNIIRKFDFAGNEIASWHSAGTSDGTATSVPVDGAAFHHDVFLMPGGTYLTSTRESLRQVDDFPLSESDPGTTGTVTIREEPVIEFDVDGQIVGKWDFLDMLKPTRIGYDAIQGQPGSTDWLHLNAIWYDPSDDSILVSLRHQDAVVKFSRMTGELIWILGNHDNWEQFEQYLLTPTNAPFTWPYHQHAPMITANGTILLFDNGNNRASPFTSQIPLPAEQNFSRAVEYQVDEQTMTISQVWEYGLNQSGESLYAPFIGDADSLPGTDNALITFGGICEIDGIPSNDIAACRVTARIIEVERTGNTTVFDLLLDDADPMTTGYKVYRSDRIPSLYPNTNVTITTLQ